MFGPSSSIGVKLSGTQSRKIHKGFVIVFLLETLKEGIVMLVSILVFPKEISHVIC